MLYKVTRILLLFMLTGISVSGSADSHGSADQLTIELAWTREGPPSVSNGAVYLVINNSGAQDVELIGGSTTAAESVEFHTHVHENGLMKMKRINHVEIPPGTLVEFSPGERHIMLLELFDPLKAGDVFPITLHFAEAEDMEVTVQVLAQGEMPSTKMSGSHKSHSQ